MTAVTKYIYWNFSLPEISNVSNWIFFFRNAHKKVQVLGAKIALVCLSSSRLQEKYQYFFSQLADHNNCLSRRKLCALLTNIVLITDYLSESLAFSSELIPATIDSCFQQVSFVEIKKLACISCNKDISLMRLCQHAYWKTKFICIEFYYVLHTSVYMQHFLHTSAV